MKALYDRPVLTSIAAQIPAQIVSISSELVDFGWESTVVADSASDAPELLPFRSEDEEDAEEASLAGVASFDVLFTAGAAVLPGSALAIVGFNASPTYMPVSALFVAWRCRAKSTFSTCATSSLLSCGIG